MKITKYILMVLFFTLPLIHGKVFETMGINLWVSILWNFEFSKSVFFNVVSSFIFISFYIENILKRKKILFPSSYFLQWILVIITLSTLFSLSPLQSLIADTEKWHTSIFFINLLGLFIVLINLSPIFLKKLIYISLTSSFFVCFLAIKEFYFPTFSYGELWSRALGSFGHPNYLSWYLLILSPFLAYIKNSFWKYILIICFLITFILTQSLWAILILTSYSFLKIPYGKIRYKLSFLWVFMWVCFSILVLFFPEKLHSFLSRFYLWQTTLLIIFSHIKIFLFGGWAETLPYFLNSFKVPELYIFENFWYTADRPHNIFLNIFYHFWFLGLCILLCLLTVFFKKIYYQKKYYTPEQVSTILFIIFWIFQFYSIAAYAIIILIIALHIRKYYPEIFIHKKYLDTIFISLITLISVIGGVYNSKLFYAETLYIKWRYLEASKLFPHPYYFIAEWDFQKAKKYEKIRSEKLIKKQVTTLPEKEKYCRELVNNYPSVENYFHCWEYFEKINKNILATTYYQKWLEKLPDLWNKNSEYWNNYFIKNTITGNRFFSEKFWDIWKVIKKYWE